MPIITDQIGNEVDVKTWPKRIISLVPSITEYLYDLGLDDRLVGITKFCVHPMKWRKEKIIIGGTKQQHLDKIRDLKPELIIANKEENEKSYVEKLSENCPVYVSDVDDFDSALEMMQDIGQLTGELETAEEIIQNIQEQFNSIEKPSGKINIAYCIWKKPWMWAGSDTFISEMLPYCNFENIVSETRYPEIQMNEIIGKNIDYVFLSSEPFPFQDKHVAELKAEYPHTQFIIVDGEMFSWYGSRMLKAPRYFRSLLDQLKSK